MLIASATLDLHDLPRDSSASNSIYAAPAMVVKVSDNRRLYRNHSRFLRRRFIDPVFLACLPKGAREFLSRERTTVAG